MASKVGRIEVYVDGSGTPAQVLTAPPFRLRLDTGRLVDGPHTLRVVTFYEAGGRDERSIPFEVDNVPSVRIEGLEDGDVVRGDVELEVRPGDYGLPMSRTKRSSLLYLGAFFLVLGAVWVFFALTPPAGQLVAAMAPSSAAAQAQEQEKTPVDKTFFDAGKKEYATYCMSCHQANGKGITGAFPPLAGNANLKDIGLVVKTVRTGKTGHVTIEGKSFNSTMPPIGAGFSAKEVAEVATYIRNRWGNAFGGVTVKQVEEHVQSGSTGGS
jgi:mono/diheme cytochrome c family protein